MGSPAGERVEELLAAAWTAIGRERFDVARAAAAKARVMARREAAEGVEADATRMLGVVASAAGDREEATRRYLSAIAAASLGPECDIDKLVHLGGLCHDVQLIDRAEALLEDALERLRRAPSPGAEVGARLLLAGVRAERVALHDDEATRAAALDAALIARDTAVAYGDVRGAAYVTICRGWLDELRGAFHEAEAHYASARESLPEGSSIRALATASLAVTKAVRLPSDPEVDLLLREARRDADHIALPNVTPSVDVRAWTVALLRDGELDPELRVKTGALRSAELQSETRMALACLERIRSTVRRAEASPEPLLEIAEDAAWFVVRGKERVDLGRRQHLRRVLRELVVTRASDAGHTWSALLEVGWPGEAMDASSGFARVRSAIWTLRKLGLEDVLGRHADGGYALVGEVRVIAAASRSR